MSIPELLKVHFFADLTQSEIEKIVPLCRLVEGKAGDALIEEKDQVRTVYFLLSGAVDVIKKPARGKRMVIGSATKGAAFGEMSLVDEGLAAATVEAKEAFQALAIDQVGLRQLMDQNPELGYKIMKTIARLVSGRLRRVFKLTIEHVPI